MATHDNETMEEGGERYNVLGPQNYNKEQLRLWSSEIAYTNDFMEIRDDFAHVDYTWGLLALLQSGAKVLGPDGNVSTFFGSSGLLAGDQEGSGWENKLEAVFYFDTGIVNHSLLLGYQASGSAIDRFRAWVGPAQVGPDGEPWNFFADGPLMLQDQFDALRAIFPDPNYVNLRDTAQVLTHAFYLAEQMSMFDDRVHALIGVRHTKTSNDGLDVSDTTPQAGIVFKPFSRDSFFADTAFFANYSKSFTPSGLVQPGTTQVVPPAKGTGREFGVNLTYRVQEDAGGIAHALALAETFSAGEPIAVLLGDNIFASPLAPFVQRFREAPKGARVLLKRVSDPERYGVAALDEQHIVSIEEKPSQPKSDYAVIGFYQYDEAVFDVIRGIRPGAMTGEADLDPLRTRRCILGGLGRQHGSAREQRADHDRFHP